MYQLSQGLGSFNGLARVCISVGCVRFGVLLRICRPVVMDVSKTCVTYIFSDQRVTYLVHMALYQQLSRILIPHLDDKVRCNENPYFVTLAHCVSATR